MELKWSSWINFTQTLNWLSQIQWFRNLENIAFKQKWVITVLVMTQNQFKTNRKVSFCLFFVKFCSQQIGLLYDRTIDHMVKEWLLSYPLCVKSRKYFFVEKLSKKQHQAIITLNLSEDFRRIFVPLKFDYYALGLKL